MGEFDGRHYVLSALKRQFADRIPTTVLIGPYCSRLTRYSVREILTDARKSAEAHIAFYERFKPDSLIVYNDIYLEAEAMGCELEFPEHNMSHMKRPLLAEQSGLASLRVPDPKKDGRLPYFLEVCERVSSAVRKTATMGLGHSGPWNLAMHLRGAEQLLEESLTEPHFVHDLMKFTTEVVKAVGDALMEAGFSPSLGEAYASCSLISPDIYRRFVKPCHKELCEYFKAKKAAMALHICGYIDPIMEDILDTGIRFISLDSPSSLRKMIEISAGRAVIMGNVPTRLFASGTAEEMDKAIDECIETAASKSGYILCSGCEIPLNSTEEQIDRFFQYGHEAGRAYIKSMVRP